MSALAKTLINGGDAFFSTAKIVSRSISAVNVTADIGKSLVKNMDFAKFSKTIGKTSDVATLSRPTSSLMDASKYLDDFASAVPSSTDDALATIAKSSDEIADLSTDVGTSVAQANTRSLSRISDATSSLQSTLKNTTSNLVPGIKRVGDDIAEQASTLAKKSEVVKTVDNVDEVGDVLKKSKGISKVDDVADAADDAGTIAKKADDAAYLAKQSNFVKFANKYGGLIQIGIFGSYMLGSYINNKKTQNQAAGEEDNPLIWTTDPETSIYPIPNDSEPQNVIVGPSDNVLLEALKDPKSIIALILVILIVIYNMVKK